VVADRHPEDAAERAEDREAQIADFEIALLEVLEWSPRLVLRVTGQMNFAVLADDPAAFVDEDRGVVTVREPAFDRQLGKPEVEADSKFARAVEQRLCRGVGHFALEI